MKLLLRHIRRTVKKSPMQPILILLTVMLSVALAVTAIRLSDVLVTHSKEQARAKEALGDILITPQGASDSRLLFEEDAERVIKDLGTVLGEFPLTAILANNESRELLHVSAVDLEKADAFYLFSYVAYGHFNTQNIDRAVVISESFAASHGLLVGDTLTLRLLEKDFTYTVQAIAKDDGLLSQSSVLISITGVSRELARRVPPIASLGDLFSPYTRLMVKLNDPSRAGEVRDMLSADFHFSDKHVEETARVEQMDFLILLQLVFVWTFMLLLLLLAGFVIASSLSLLHRRRRAEYDIFACVGASPTTLRGLLYIESLIYAALGGIMGLFFSVPLVHGAGGLYDWYTEPLAPNAIGLLFGLLVAPLLMLLCTAVYLRREKRKKVSEVPHAAMESGIPTADWLIPALLLLLSTVLAILLPVAYAYIAASVALMATVWLLFVAMPLLLRWFAGMLEKSLLCLRAPAGFVVLAVKNIKGRFAVRHTGRLIAVLVALLASIMTCKEALSNQIGMMTEDLPFDFLAYNVSVREKQQLQGDESVLATMSMIYIPGVELQDGASAVAVSLEGDHSLCLPEGLAPQRLPTGRELVLSTGLAIRTNTHVGDSVSLQIGGASHLFTVTEIVATNGNFLYLDSTEIGIARDLFCVRLQPDATQAQRDSMVATLEASGAAVAEPTSAFGVLPHTLSGHLKLMSYAVLAATVLALLGCINAFVQQYRERLEEWSLLRACGMTRRGMIGILITEATLLIFFALLCGGLAGGIMNLFINRGMHSFGMVLFA